jgi:hypothetical protein
MQLSSLHPLGTMSHRVIEGGLKEKKKLLVHPRVNVLNNVTTFLQRKILCRGKIIQSIHYWLSSETGLLFSILSEILCFKSGKNGIQGIRIPQN